jgi:hypothetical protein
VPRPDHLVGAAIDEALGTIEDALAADEREDLSSDAIATAAP